MTKVIVPYQLRDRCGGQRAVEVEAETVRDMVDAIEAKYPGMKFSICLETGELRPFVNVFVGQEDVRYMAGLDTPVRGETVHIIHSVAGG